MEKENQPSWFRTHQKPSVFHRKQGLEVEQLLSTSGHGRNIFLDIPLLGAFYSPKKGLPAGNFYHVFITFGVPRNRDIPVNHWNKWRA